MLGEQIQHEALGPLECLLLAVLASSLSGDEIKLGHAHHNVLDFKRPATNRLMDGQTTMENEDGPHLSTIAWVMRTRAASSFGSSMSTSAATTSTAESACTWWRGYRLQPS
jgi:hypothetical protein